MTLYFSNYLLIIKVFLFNIEQVKKSPHTVAEKTCIKRRFSAKYVFWGLTLWSDINKKCSHKFSKHFDFQ